MRKSEGFQGVIGGGRFEATDEGLRDSRDSTCCEVAPDDGSSGDWQAVASQCDKCGANYRAACRSRSPAEFRSKLGILEEEADESCYWIELLGEAGIVDSNRLTDLLKEANEITAMIVASIKTSKEKGNE